MIWRLPPLRDPFDRFAEIMQGRRREADEFYRAITPERVSKDGALVMRQALAGMLWSKQYFSFDVDKWLTEHGVDPLQPGGKPMRNSEWFHMVNDHIISMPDKWEYPWYAAWDLAFHTIALSTVDGSQETTARPDAAGVLPASDRSDPGLRVELQRRQPARACMGNHLHVPDGTGAQGRSRPGVSQEVFAKLMLNFQLVGEQRSLWQEPL